MVSWIQRRDLLGTNVSASIFNGSMVLHYSWKRKSTWSFVITEEAPTRAFCWLKVATTASTFKTPLRQYANQPACPLCPLHFTSMFHGVNTCLKLKRLYQQVSSLDSWNSMLQILSSDMDLQFQQKAGSLTTANIHNENMSKLWSPCLGPRHVVIKLGLFIYADLKSQLKGKWPFILEYISQIITF